MKVLPWVCACSLLCAGPAHAAALAGDPFSDEESFAGLETVNTPDTLLLGGFAESRNQLPLRAPGQPLSLRQKAQVEGLLRRETLSVFGELAGSLEGAAATWPGEHTLWRAGFRELYLGYDTETVDILVGRKIHRWGTGDGINPMDLVNPLDTRDPLSSGRADNRLPVWSISAAVSKKGVSLEGIMLPLAGVNTLPPSGNPWEPRLLRSLREGEKAGDWSLSEPEKPERWFRDVEYGTRLSTNLQGWDLALMGFRGYADTPLFTGSAQEGGMEWRSEYQRFSALGLSFAKGFGSQTIRGEAACKPRFPVQGEREPRRTDLWQAVFGWDWDIDGAYYLNFQVFADQQGLADATGKRRWHGGAYEVSGTWCQDALKAGIRGRFYTSGEGTLTELFLEYELDDHWKVSTGIMCWSGTQDSILGQYTENDFTYLTLRYVF